MEQKNVRAKRIGTLAVWVGLLVVVCIGVSYFVTLAMVKGDQSWKHDQARGHHWLHEQLALTEGEIAAIDAFEPDYRGERARLLAAFEERVAKLRGLLVVKDQFSPEVTEAIHSLHSVHGELQKLSIRHYYDMMSVLPPEKQEKLKRLAVEALSEPE